MDCHLIHVNTMVHSCTACVVSLHHYLQIDTLTLAYTCTYVCISNYSQTDITGMAWTIRRRSCFLQSSRRSILWHCSASTTPPPSLIFSLSLTHSSSPFFFLLYSLTELFQRMTSCTGRGQQQQQQKKGLLWLRYVSI